MTPTDTTMTNALPQSLSEDLQMIRNYCLERDLKIAAAESATAGCVQLLLSGMSDARLFFQGGVTAYTLDIKNKLLAIPLPLGESTNGVDATIADLMAVVVSKLFQSDFGLSITGYASKVPELGITEKFAYASISFSGKVVMRCKIVSQEPSQYEAQQDFARQLIHQCRMYLDRIVRQEEFRLPL